jgi:methylated-DNA-[protein]-cysteine S-methyltransferase
MAEQNHALFDTPIGPCAIAWGAKGIVGLQLSEGDAARTLARLMRRFPDSSLAEPPADIRTVTNAIVGLLHGEPVDLAFAKLDMDGIDPFPLAVYEAARRIPPGRVSTYGAIATDLGNPADARAVGQALGANPFALIVPCHRVVAAGGKLGGFSANGGRVTKRRLLEIEKARIGDEPDLFDTAGRG